MFGIKYNFYQDDMTNTNRVTHQTLLFQTFVFMSLANMVNCRVLGTPPTNDDQEQLGANNQASKELAELNIFTRIWTNWWFLIVWFGELALQLCMVGFTNMHALDFLFQTKPLDWRMQLTASCCALGSWILAIAVKKTPYRWTAMFPDLAEDEATLIASRRSIDAAADFARVKDEE